MTTEKAASLETQGGWLDGYTSRPFDLTQTSEDYRTGYRAGEKSRTRDAARKTALAAITAEVRARSGVQDA